MKINAPITTIMTRSVITIDIQEPLHAAKDLMLAHHIRHLPVLKNGKLAGIISRTDIMRLSFSMTYQHADGADDAILDMLTIEQVMAGNVRSISSHATIQEAANIFTQEEFHALPITENGELVGIVTTTDLIRCMLYGQLHAF